MSCSASVTSRSPLGTQHSHCFAVMRKYDAGAEQPERIEHGVASLPMALRAPPPESPA